MAYKLGALGVVHLRKMRRSLSHGVKVRFFLRVKELRDILGNVLSDCRSRRKSGRLYAGNVVDILRFSARLDNEILFVGRRADAGEICYNVLLRQSGHGDSLLCEHARDALGIGGGVLALGRFDGVGAYEQVIVHRMQYAAALGVRLDGALRHDDGGDSMKACAGLFVKNRVCAAARMNTEESVLRHLRNNVGVDSGAVYHLARIYRSSVCVNRFYLAVGNVHSGNGCVQRDPCAVLHRVLGIGNDKIIRAYATRRGI